LIVKLSPFFIDRPGFAAHPPGADFEGGPTRLYATSIDREVRTVEVASIRDHVE